MDTQDFWDSVFEKRLLVFLEEDDGFYQVGLNQEQFKKVSDAIGRVVGTNADGYDEVEVAFVESAVVDKKHFENMKSIQ